MYRMQNKVAPRKPNTTRRQKHTTTTDQCPHTKVVNYMVDYSQVEEYTPAKPYDDAQAYQPPDQHSDMAPFSEPLPHPGNP